MSKEADCTEKVKSAIKDAVSSNLFDHMKTYLVNLTHKAQDIAYQTEKKILENLFASVMLIAGVVLIIFAVVFFINDFFGLERYWGFLIVGMLLIIISLVYKRRIDRTKYYDL